MFQITLAVLRPLSEITETTTNWFLTETAAGKVRALCVCMCVCVYVCVNVCACVCVVDVCVFVDVCV